MALHAVTSTGKALMPSTSPPLGHVRQIGYVVDDLDAAVVEWVSLLNVGPFFVTRAMRLFDFDYRGESSDPEISVGLAQSGSMQIELIQQDNAEPSAWMEFRTKGRRGIQHVAYWTQQFDRDLGACEAHGITIVQSIGSVSGGPNERAVYFHPTQQPDMLIELSEVMGWKREALSLVATAAADWDGRDAIRSWPVTSPPKHPSV
jgi:hypothetical protein